MCEARGTTPDGGGATSIMTLGFDPDRGRFTGTFVASMMTHLWIYEGELDAAGSVLTLDTEGPAYTGEGMMKYRDTIELRGDDHRVQTSSYQREDGSWNSFMTTHYRRNP
jgi:surface antigen